MENNTRILALLHKLKPITLEEMSGIRLMNRTDTKFVTNKAKLEQLLEMADELETLMLMAEEEGDDSLDDESRVTVNDDICATAKGYERMLEMQLLRGGGRV